MKFSILKNQLCTIRLALLLFFFYENLFVIVANGQCIATTAQSGSVINNDATIGNLSFFAPSNASTSDNNRTTASAIATVLSGNTNYLRVTGFNFNIPALSNICGIRVEVENRAGGLGIGAWIKDNVIRLVKNGVIDGENLANIDDDWTGTEIYHGYGGANELWDLSLTPSDVNAPNFGVVFSASYQGLALVLPSVQIDHIRMIIYYDPSLPTRLISFSATSTNKMATLKWTTADEENDEYIQVQRTVTGQNSWINIARFDMHTGNQGKAYTYTDRLDKNGEYSYRLEIINVNGHKTYSEIRNVRVKGSGNLSVYPNPTTDLLVIDVDENISDVIITNSGFQVSKSRIIRGSDGLAKIDVRSLAQGRYYASAGHYRFSFIKQ